MNRTMKSALSLTLGVWLAGPALPASAQGKMARSVASEMPTAPGPIARAVTDEVARLAATGERTPSSVETVQQAQTSDTAWKHVRNLEPSAEIVITTRDLQLSRYFLHAGESEITVLDLTNPSLANAVRRVLLAAAKSPGNFDPGRVYRESDMRIEAGEVFVAGLKVAERGQIVQKIARTDVIAVIHVRAGRSVWRGALWGTLGYFGGGMAGGMIGGTANCVAGHCGPADANIPSGMLVGLVGGAAAGSVWGGIHGYRHKIDDVIYVAP